jgi:hypothetical protein
MLRRPKQLLVSASVGFLAGTFLSVALPNVEIASPPPPQPDSSAIAKASAEIERAVSELGVAHDAFSKAVIAAMSAPMGFTPGGDDKESRRLRETEERLNGAEAKLEAAMDARFRAQTTLIVPPPVKVGHLVVAQATLFPLEPSPKVVEMITKVGASTRIDQLSAKVVAAELAGDAFGPRPVASNARRELKGTEPAVWYWQIRAKEAGKQDLFLTISGVGPDQDQKVLFTMPSTVEVEAAPPPSLYERASEVIQSQWFWDNIGMPAIKWGAPFLGGALMALGTILVQRRWGKQEGKPPRDGHGKGVPPGASVSPRKIPPPP